MTDSVKAWALKLHPDLIPKLSTSFKSFHHGKSVRTFPIFHLVELKTTNTSLGLDFGKPTGKVVGGVAQYAVEANLKGFLGASYSLGAILSLPFVPYVNQTWGRRWSIMFGSLVSVVGAILQAFANGSRSYVLELDKVNRD